MELMKLLRLQTYLVGGLRREHGLYLWMSEV